MGSDTITTLPALQTPCSFCDAHGAINDGAGWEGCPFCHGAGYVPTETGRQILDLIGRNFRYLERDFARHTPGFIVDRG